MKNTGRQKLMCLYFVKIITGISQSPCWVEVGRVETNAFKKNSFHTFVVVFITVTQIIVVHNSLSWIDSSKMSCFVSNVCLVPGFFTCTAWLTVNRVFQCHPCSAVAQYEKGCVKVRQATSVLWPSMLLPTPLSLPKHSIPPQPSAKIKRKHPQNISKAGIWPRSKRRMNVWNRLALKW